MPLPTWVPGQVLTASDVNTWLVPLQAFKPASQGVLNSTTLTNDTDLHVALAANAIYAFDSCVAWIAVSGTDFKWQWTVPAGATLLYQPLYNAGGPTGFGNSNNAYGASDVLSATGQSPQVTAVRFGGTVQTAATAGNLQFTFAQATLSAVNTTYSRAGSYINMQRIG